MGQLISAVSRFGFVRHRQPDPAVGVREVFRQMFAVGRGDPGSTAPSATEGCEQLEPDGVKLSQVNDHLGQAVLPARGQKVPPGDSSASDRTANICRFEEALIDERVGVADKCNCHRRGLLVDQGRTFESGPGRGSERR